MLFFGGHGATVEISRLPWLPGTARATRFRGRKPWVGPLQYLVFATRRGRPGFDESNDGGDARDLLFRHRVPKALVAVELKVGKFEPEYAVVFRRWGHSASPRQRTCRPRGCVSLVRLAFADFATWLRVFAHLLTRRSGQGKRHRHGFAATVRTLCRRGSFQINHLERLFAAVCSGTPIA